VVDVGDIVGVSGGIKRTEKGELSVLADKLKVRAGHVHALSKTAGGGRGLSVLAKLGVHAGHVNTLSKTAGFALLGCRCWPAGWPCAQVGAKGPGCKGGWWGK